jgi:hypothetical protein
MYRKWKKAKDTATATVTPASPCVPCANLQSATYYS